jgi:hypothetical protein
MKHTIRYGVAVVGFATALGASAGALAVGSGPSVGAPGDSELLDRTITIGPNTKWVNVTGGETVRFVDTVSNKSFVWHFDAPNWETFDLAQVAPDALAGQHVVAYVAQNPEDNSGD